MDADWVSPTGFEDPANHWTDEAKAYDDDLETYCYNTVVEHPTSEIILTHAGVSGCTKIRFMMAMDSSTVYYGRVDIRVYYSGGWHSIANNQTYSKDAWQEVNVGSSQTISKVEFTFDPTLGNSLYPRLKEVDFYGEIAVLHELVVTDGINIGEALIKNPVKVLSDGFDIGDTLVKHIAKMLSDGIALTDIAIGYRLLVRTLTDGIAVGESLTKEVQKVLSDGIKFTDICFRTFSKVLSDGIAVGESLVKMTVKVLVDGIKFTDIRFTTFVKVFVDGIKFHDFLIKWRWLTPLRRLKPHRLWQPKRRTEL